MSVDVNTVKPVRHVEPIGTGNRRRLTAVLVVVAVVVSAATAIRSVSTTSAAPVAEEQATDLDAGRSIPQKVESSDKTEAGVLRELANRGLIPEQAVPSTLTEPSPAIPGRGVDRYPVPE